MQQDAFTFWPLCQACNDVLTVQFLVIPEEVQDEVSILGNINILEQEVSV